MNDLEEFLSSIGVVSEEPAAQSEEVTPTEELNHTDEPVQASNNLSEDDFNDILSDMGFQESSEEEIHDGSDDTGVIADDEEDYDDNIEEGRDLDAEEDADWDRLAAAGVINPANNFDTSGATESSNANTEERSAFQEGTLPELNEAHQSITEDSQQNGPLIPPNSPTLLQDDSTSRFSGTEWYNEIRKQRIILAGCGGIGSWTALQLARMSPESLFIYDDDVVEMANMSGQLYGGEDIGLNKVDAISRTLHNYTTAQNIYALNQRFTPETEAGDIMICGFDNMKARRTFFDAWVKHILSYENEENRKKCLFIDGRLSIDTLQVFCIRGDDYYNKNRYGHDFLFSDEEADHTVCSMKQTTYLACMIGSLIVNLFTNHVANCLDPIIPYDLPFFTEYDSQHMIFKTEN